MKVSEYVSLGHPDKTADYISEYILDRLIEQDPKTRYGLEVQVKDNYVTLGGEITTNAKKLKYKKWVKEAIEKIGYTHEYAKKWGKNNCLDASKVKVATHISKQSHDIAIGVDENKNQGWGDQGQFWGYSSNVPLFKNMGFGYYVAKMLAQSLYNEALHSNYFGLDIKTQVTTDDTDTFVRKIVVAIPTLRDKQVTETFVKEVICDVQNAYVGEILGSDDDVYRIDDFENIELIVNGTGAYVTHSSIGDCGTTGRKLAVDFYGGDCIIGGGSPWTKDSTKADLTLNMYARELAVAYGKKYKKPVRVSIGCCIGRSDLDITVYDDANKRLLSYSTKITPLELTNRYNLQTPIYAYMCKQGIVSYMNELQEANERILANV